jgi:hypothetical protein
LKTFQEWMILTLKAVSQLVPIADAVVATSTADQIAAAHEVHSLPNERGLPAGFIDRQI